jgi:hypothetical protein
MSALITRHRLLQLTSFASTQLVVQVIGFAVGIVLIRSMNQVDYGYYTLALSMVGMASVLTDLGLSAGVMAQGGPLFLDKPALSAVLRDADVLHRRLTLPCFVVLLPCFTLMLLRQQVSLQEILVLLMLIAATTWFTVRGGLVLSVVRLMGFVGYQQRLDLAIGASKLAIVLALAWLASGLNAPMACLVNLGVAAAGLALLRRHLVGQGMLPNATCQSGTNEGLKKHLWKQAPNSIYFVLSSQLALWLIGIFGNAERVAEVGALGRLAAVFTVIGAVSAAMILPYFARQDSPSALSAAFASVNIFFGVLLALLTGLAALFPAAILWVLGGQYSNLQTELVWMVIAATLSAWGGTLYSIGCARGWVLPVWLAVSTGLAATVAAAIVVDVATVRGSFIINTATALSGTVVSFGYLVWRLRRHAFEKAGVA